MGFWTAVAVICVAAIVTEFIIRVVKIGTKYSENIERIKHGYPTLDGSRSMNYGEAAHKPEESFTRMQ